MTEQVERRWRFIDRKKFKAQFQFEPRDLWVGLFWRRTELCLHLYVCLLPTVPLHVTITCDKWIAAYQEKRPNERND